MVVPALLAAFGLAPLASAQQGAVKLPFDGRSLELEVIGGAPAGDVEIVDGEPGVIVMSGAGSGSSIALEGGVLSLTDRSAARVDYRVRIPPGTNVSLSVNGRAVLAMAAAGGGRHMVWRWPGPGAVMAGGYPRPVTDGRPRRSFTVSAFAGPPVVDSVDVSYPERIEMLKVIVGGENFGVSGDRAVSFGYHRPTRWGVVTPRADSLRVTVEVPGGMRSFQIRIGDDLIWQLSDGIGRTLCDPVAEIQRRDGRMMWSFTPEAGRLRCRRDSDTRREQKS